MNRAASAAVNGNTNAQIVPDPFWTFGARLPARVFSPNMTRKFRLFGALFRLYRIFTALYL